MNKELFFFKEIKQKVSALEITNFIEKTLCIKIEKCIEVTKEDEYNLQLIFEKEFESLKALSVLKNNFYKYVKTFLSVVCVTLLCVGGAFYYEYYQNSNDTMKQKEIIVYPSKELITEKLALVFKNINELRITLLTLDLNNEWLTLTLQHANKASLIDFLTQYKCEVKTLHYNDKEKLYELSATFKLI